MNILTLLNNARNIFNRLQITEIPQYPSALPASWLHPDFLVSSCTTDKSSLFTFQPLKFYDSLLNKNIFSKYNIVCFFKPYRNDIYDLIQCFFTDFINECNLNINNLSISLSATDFCRLNFDERGCEWKILINGVEFGRYTILTEFASRKFNSPVCTCSINLELFAKFCDLNITYKGWCNKTGNIKFIADEIKENHCNPDLYRNIIEKLQNNKTENDFETVFYITELIKHKVIEPKSKKVLQKIFLNAIDNIKRINKQKSNEVTV